MSATYEYRVRWKRRGRRARGVILQTKQAARAKAERLVRIDELVAERDEETLDSMGLGHLLARYRPDLNVDYEDLPALEAPPTIERRTVGDWTPAA